MKPVVNIPSIPCAILIALVTGRLVAGEVEIASSPSPDIESFGATVQPFFRSHCIKCHGPEKSKAGIRLDKIDGNVALGREMETWEAVLEQLTMGEMPPEEEQQPSLADRERVLSWVSGELKKGGRSEAFKHKLSRFAFGNLVDHDDLFSGEIEDMPSSPPRLWRLNPNIYDRTKKRVFRDYWEELKKVRQPYAIDDKAGIGDYAAHLFADSATLETLLRNARDIVEFQLTREVPLAFREVIASDSHPTDEQIDATIRFQFQTLISRDPSSDETTRYAALMQRSIAKAGNQEGLRVGLKAIALSPEAIYRMELGLGPKDAHGRSPLSPGELIFAIAYALTDDPPDEHLTTAARNGKLTSRDNVREQVTRILADTSIAKPRILRFFQEFFGYHRAGRVFKDENRYHGYFYADVAPQLVHEADLLVLHILRNDRDVLKQLLTTDKFFVGHVGSSADVEALEGRLDALRLFYDYWKDKTWKGMDYELEPNVRADIQALHPYFRTQPMQHRTNGDTVKFYMPYLTMCYANGIRPMLAEHIMMKGERERNLTFNDGHRRFLIAFNLSEEDFDCPVEQPFVIKEGQRAGILTHPAWLVAHSKNTETNPITRGKWIRERLLAGHVPDVPITVQAVVPENPQKTLRQRFEVTRQAECWRCHQKMNPLGMTFEMYDDFGRFRSTDEENGQTIAAGGALDSSGDDRLDGEVENAIELVQRLAQSHRVRQSFVRHAFRYWMGRNELLSDSKTLIAADNAYVENKGSFRAMLISLLTSDSFLYRKPPQNGTHPF